MLKADQISMKNRYTKSNQRGNGRMRLELYDEIALLFHSEEKDIYLVQHMIENLFYVKKVIRTKQDLMLYEVLKNHPHIHLANVIEFAYRYNKTIIIEEFINGCTLEYLMSQRPIPLHELKTILQQLFSSISHLHHQQPPIIHRDIKPENILIKQQHSYLIDFEIAKLYQKDVKDTKRFGSIGYAAPEQYHGESDQRSDIYAMGIVLKELLKVSDLSLRKKALFDSIVQRSTAQDLHARYQTIEDMQQAVFGVISTY